MTAEREMTLHEWVGKLPEIHLARKELVAMQASIAAMESSELFYRRRCEALQEIQSRMRDPERQMVCDILANGIPRDKAGIGEYLGGVE